MSIKVENVCELTSYEQYILNLTQSGDENVIGIARLEAEKALDEDVVREALYFMFKRHPLFRAVVKRDEVTKKYYFEVYSESSRCASDMKYECSELKEYDERILINELEAFNSLPFGFGNDRLLWRFKLVSCLLEGRQVYVFALILPLYITDGLNMTSLCIEIFNILNCLVSNKECEEMRERLSLGKNMYELLNEQGWCGEEIQQTVDELIRNDKYINFNLPYSLRPQEKEVQQAKMSIFKLTEGVTSAIIRESKQRKVRLTGYLIAAGLLALKQLYSELSVIIQRDFSCIVPANLRIRMKPEVNLSDARFLVVLTSMNLFYPSLNLDGEIWSNAKYINERIAEKTRFDNGSLLQYSHNFKAIDNANACFDTSSSPSEFSAEINRSNFCDFLVSNLGTHVTDRKQVHTDGKLHLTELYHGDCLTSFPSNFSAMMLHVCTFNQQLMFQLSVNRHVIASEHVERFIEILKLVFENSVS